MNAMVFAAGLGTRLRPLTDDKPKALVNFRGKTMLESVLEKLADANITRIIVNVHHFAPLVIAYLSKLHFKGVEILVSDESGLLLDTGGGLKQAKSLFEKGQSVLIHNVDILSNVDLKELQYCHLHSDNYATMCVRPAERGRVLLFGDDGCLEAWQNTTTSEVKIARPNYEKAKAYSFTGIHIVSPHFLLNMHYEGVFSIIDEYIYQAKSHDIKAWNYNGYFKDLGSVQSLEEAEREYVTR